MRKKKSTLPDKNREYSVTEITEMYRKTNEELSEAFNIFINIYNTVTVTENDYKKLSKLNLNFVTLEMNYEEIQIHGDSLYQIILDSVFTELMTSACDFYGQYNSDFWFSAYDKGNKIIIKNGIFVSEMLKLYDTFYRSLSTINQLMEFAIVDDDPEFDEFIEFTPGNFDAVYYTIKSMNSVEEKINYLNNEITEKELICLRIRKDSEFHKELQNFISNCKSAVEILSRDIQNARNHSMPDTVMEHNKGNNDKRTENPKFREFTTLRQSLAVYYMLMSIDSKVYNQSDRTTKARFVEFLTGKNYDNIKDYLANLFAGFDKQNYTNILNNLKFVKTQFENLGYNTIVEQIDRDISAEMESKEKNNSKK